ncbi:hypothetical protein O0L34_g14876 [Tuta absoluta]|nr:hypothetical protein O0L34_g14876 [Tuta absoluta]
MARVIVFLCVVAISAVYTMPTENKAENEHTDAQIPTTSGHSLWKRYINQDFGSFPSPGLSRMRTRRFVNLNPMFAVADVGTKMRTKRSAEECEKLSLCQLHARSQHNFISAFELYFVNKENARLWDHHARRLAECRQRFSECYDN